MIGLRNAVNKQIIYVNENPDKLIDIVEKILDYYNQQKSKKLKILTPKQMLQSVPIALAQVKASNTSENLLNKIRKIIHSLYQAKKVYNNIMNSVQF